MVGGESLWKKGSIGACKAAPLSIRSPQETAWAAATIANAGRIGSLRFLRSRPTGDWIVGNIQGRCWNELRSVLFRFPLPRQPRRILMRALAECTAHARSQAHTGLAELITQAIGCGQSVFPALLAAAFEQIHLIGLS
jgi:hypothetical protein